jgi:hypothetical protein
VTLVGVADGGKRTSSPVRSTFTHSTCIWNVLSCKRRGVCPSCNGRHMAQTAAHLADHVIPPVPVRQWVISVPKRLRGVLGERPKAIAAVTRILLDEIETLLSLDRLRCARQATPSSPRSRLGAVSFLHRFGSGLNRHAHLHAAVTDGVFLPGPDGPPDALRRRREGEAAG